MALHLQAAGTLRLSLEHITDDRTVLELMALAANRWPAGARIIHPRLGAIGMPILLGYLYRVKPMTLNADAAEDFQVRSDQAVQLLEWAATFEGSFDNALDYLADQLGKKWADAAHERYQSQRNR